MTKKLAETFGIDEEITEGTDYINDIDEPQTQIITNDEKSIDEYVDSEEVIEHINEMNNIYNIALDSHEKTLTFGMNVDPKNASAGLSASTSYLTIALNASKSKIEKKLSYKRLLLEKEKNNNQVIGKQQKTDMLQNNDSENIEIVGEVMDRNELIAELKRMKDEIDNIENE